MTKNRVRIAVSKLGHWAAFQIEEPPVMAANGKEAIRTMRELHPHLAFVDMNMPVMNGSQFLQQAAAEFPDTRFIVISGYDEFSYAQQAIRCGAVDYLLKPIIEEDLNQAILHAMQSIDPSFAPLPQDRCSAPPDSDAVIDIIRDYIDKNYTENIKISMFADRYFSPANTSRSSLSHATAAASMNTSCRFAWSAPKSFSSTPTSRSRISHSALAIPTTTTSARRSATTMGFHQACSGRGRETAGERETAVNHITASNIGFSFFTFQKKKPLNTGNSSI